MPSQIERIAAMETRLDSLEKSVEDINHKLDDLLALRYKGLGAFWLASTLVGTGIFGFIYYLFGGR